MEPTLRKPERGEAVLNATRAFIGRFATFPSQAALDLATLWVAHTHVRDNDGLLALACSPRFVVLSDEPGSGKTRVLELITLLSHRGQMTIDLTPPAFALTVAQDRATVTIDETDVLFGSGKAKAVLRSLLNSGYRAKGADWKRANGDSLNVFGPVAMAGLGARFRNSSDLSALRSRCFMFDMHRGTPPDPYKPRLHDPYAEALAADLARWAADQRARITEDVPDDLEGIRDRAAELCEPILQIANAAGGHWPESARKAVREILTGETIKDPAAETILTVDEQLILDLRRVFGDERHLSTITIAERLRALPGTIWARMWPSPQDAPRELAALLAPYGIEATKIRVGEQSLRGYKRRDIAPLWDEEDAPENVPLVPPCSVPEDEKTAA
jgi:hypothetical protein